MPSQTDPKMRPQNASLHKHTKGRAAYFKGAAAECAVAQAYIQRGATLLEERWRGIGGEIDLIFLQAGVYVFCEVKAARSFEDATARLNPAQMHRIHNAASEYLTHCPDGQLSEVRFDLVAVDAHGQLRIFENAFGHF